MEAVTVLDDFACHAEQLQAVQRFRRLWLVAFDDLFEACFQAVEVDLLVLPERTRLAQLQGKGFGTQLLIGVRGKGD
ncbi:hypothetical protein D3C77_648000 [compost metagenome]